MCGSIHVMWSELYEHHMYQSHVQCNVVCFVSGFYSVVPITILLVIDIEYIDWNALCLQHGLMWRTSNIGLQRVLTYDVLLFIIMHLLP